MNRPNRSTIIGVATTVAIVAGGMVTVWWVASCRPPGDQADMIELFEADPLVATAPDDGQLVDEYSHTYTCDSGLPRGESPTGPGFAEVRRLYQTPAAYRVDQLRQRFDQPAADGGWRLLFERRPGDPVVGDGAAVVYCKEAGGRAALAHVNSSTATVYEEPSDADESGRQLPGVEVLLSADPDHGTDCNDALQQYREFG